MKKICMWTKYACELFLNIVYLCDPVLYDPSEPLYYNQTSGEF